MKSSPLILILLFSFSITPACSRNFPEGDHELINSYLVACQLFESCITYSIGGTVSGLVGANLVLSNNSNESITISTNGSFTFTGGLTTGSAYNVSVAGGPSPYEACTVTEGSGTINYSAVSNISISCFDPSDVSGMTIWLRTESLSLSDSDPVSNWPDASGNGNDAAQATSTLQPTFTTNAQNGRPAIRFDGTDDGLIIADSSTYKTAVIQYFIVCHNTADGTVVLTYPHALANTTPFHRWLFFRGAAGAINVRIDTDNITTGAINTNWDTNAIYSYDTQNRDMYINGSLFYDGTGRNVTYPTSTGLRLGNNVVGTSNQNGDILEFILYDNTLSQTNRELIECYLSTKYNISVGHSCS